MSDEINAILNDYHFAALWEMANAAGLEVKDERGKKLSKEKVLAKMRAEFFTRERVQASWKQLDERERAVLNRLLLRGGTAATNSFRREIIRAGLATEAEEPKTSARYPYYYRPDAPYANGYAGNPERRHSPVFEDVIARLTHHGLVFSRGTRMTSGSTPYKLQFHPGTTLYVPEVIRRYLPEPEPIPPSLAGWQPTRVETGTPALLLRDLYLYWDLVRRNDVALVQTGFVGKNWLKTINQILLVPDPLLEKARREDETGQLYLLRQLLEKLGLVRIERGYLRPAGKAGASGRTPLQVPDFWGQSPTEQLRACLEAWSQSVGHGGLGGDANKYGPRYPHARQTVLAVLKTLPPNVWLEPEELLEEVRARDLDFLFPEHSRIENSRSDWYSSYSPSYYFGERKTLLKTLEELEARFVNHCLTGFLHQIGAVDLGYDGDTLQGFRLTPRSRAILGLEPPEQPSQVSEDETGRLIVQPSFQLIAMGPVSLALLAQLDLFADRERADQGVFEYRLSRESVYRAQQLGMDVADVIRFLSQNSDTELPQNVRRSLEEWAAHHERIVFRTGVSLLQAADADLLAALMGDPRTGQHLARSVSPEVALIRNHRQQPLVSALVSQGLFPAVSGAQPEAADHSVIIQEDGTIRPIHAVPSLHLRGRLSRLAEETADGGWRLTPESVGRAGGSRTKVLHLLDELRQLHRGPFPSELAEQVKAWGGYYGHAAVETLTLIEFRDQAALEELRQHSALRAYLTPFPAGDRALAVVPAEKLAQVKEILARFGVRVKDGLIRSSRDG
ncbi:MAG: helicase-associated domain-containing protein [Armatimonadota bacterium]|nr:helicase-associated domain-containing protein [Armatimonadota bacterium]